MILRFSARANSVPLMYSGRVSQHSLYGWKKKYSGPKGAVEDNRDAEIRQLKRELARVTEERDILKKATAYFVKGEA